jgi:hypothetical protein
MGDKEKWEFRHVPGQSRIVFETSAREEDAVAGAEGENDSNLAAGNKIRREKSVEKVSKRTK